MSDPMKEDIAAIKKTVTALDEKFDDKFNLLKLDMERLKGSFDKVFGHWALA